MGIKRWVYTLTTFAISLSISNVSMAQPESEDDETVDFDFLLQAMEPELQATASAQEVEMIPVTQEDAAPTPEPPQKPAARSLEEVVVTATKRELSIRDIPASISVFTGAALEQSGKLDMIDYLRETPGVTMTHASQGSTRLTFRGVSTDTNPYSSASQPVGIFIGDVAFTDPYIANIIPDLSAFDLAGVEVLKGPQGTLFGGAALSGAVRYKLEEPTLDNWAFKGFSQFVAPTGGSFAFTQGVAFNAPLPDSDLAIRFGYINREYPGVNDNLRSGRDDVNAASGNQYRAQVLWAPGSWKFLLTHLSQDFWGPDQLVLLDMRHGPRETDRAILESPSRNEFSLDSLEISREFDTLRFTSLTSRVRRFLDFTIDLSYALAGDDPPPEYPEALGLMSKALDISENFAQELRLQSSGNGRFNWLVGLYYFDYDMYFHYLLDTPANQAALGSGSAVGGNGAIAELAETLGLPAPGAATALIDTTGTADSTEKAVFADLSYVLGDALTLTAGGRFYKTEIHGGFVGNGVLTSGSQNDGATTNTVGSLEESGFNPKFTATYQLNSDHSVYASAAKGFRFGGINATPSTAVNGIPQTWKSDTLWNYELGLRTEWMDGTLWADVAAFYISYKNPIIEQQTENAPITYKTNVSAAVSKGVEGSITWNTPFQDLRWTLTGAYTDAYITEEFTAANGDTVSPGQEMPGAAKVQFGTSLDTLLQWGRLSFAPNISYNYIGKAYNSLTHDIVVNDYGTLNAGLSIGSNSAAGDPRLTLSMTNILDVIRPMSGRLSQTIGTRQPTQTYIHNPPRTFIARFSFEF